MRQLRLQRSVVAIGVANRHAGYIAAPDARLLPISASARRPALGPFADRPPIGMAVMRTDAEAVARRRRRRRLLQTIAVVDGLAGRQACTRNRSGFQATGAANRLRRVGLLSTSGPLTCADDSETSKRKCLTRCLPSESIECPTFNRT
jgi:hypothetical protein